MHHPDRGSTKTDQHGDRPLTLPKLVSETLVHIGETEFAEGLRQAGLKHEVDHTPGITCFAPTNEALSSIHFIENLTPAQRTHLLSNHILLNATAYSPALLDGMSFNTAAGYTITIVRKGDELFINEARVLKSDVITKNGVCHVIDKVRIKACIAEYYKSLEET